MPKVKAVQMHQVRPVSLYHRGDVFAHNRMAGRPHRVLNPAARRWCRVQLTGNDRTLLRNDDRTVTAGGKRAVQNGKDLLRAAGRISCDGRKSVADGQDRHHAAISRQWLDVIVHP